MILIGGKKFNFENRVYYRLYLIDAVDEKDGFGSCVVAPKENKGVPCNSELFDIAKKLVGCDVSLSFDMFGNLLSIS